MPNAARIEPYKWPKRHQYVVEECKSLHVNDVSIYLDRFHRSILRTFNPQNYPNLLLVSRMGGPFKRWWWECPHCRRRRDALYLPPDVSGWDWRCRKCWDLVYASQRYGYRHPLRKKLTYRKKRSLQNEVILQTKRARRKRKVMKKRFLVD